jgi:hypothetical protein
VKGDKSIYPLHADGEKRQDDSKKTYLLCVVFKETSTHRVGNTREDGEVIRTCDKRVEESLHVFNEATYGEFGGVTDVISGEAAESDKWGVGQVLIDPLVDVVERGAGLVSERVVDTFCPDIEFCGSGQVISVGGPAGVFVDFDTSIGNKTRKAQVVVYNYEISESIGLHAEGEIPSPFHYIQKEIVKSKPRGAQKMTPKCIQFVEAVNNSRKGGRKKKR